MKKLVFSLIAVACLGFIGCSDDEDDNNCESCTALEQTIEICDNGDGTFSVTSADGTETINESDLNGLTPKQVVDLTCALLNDLPSGSQE